MHNTTDAESRESRDRPMKREETLRRRTIRVLLDEGTERRALVAAYGEDKVREAENGRRD